MTDPDSWDSWIEGGVDIAVPTVANWETPTETRDLLDQWDRWLTDDDLLIGIDEPTDFDQFPVAGKLGVIIHFQNTLPLGDDLANYERFYRQGLRMVQICYNRTNLVGDGCLEPGDGPLSSFGREVIREMNRLGMVVDLSHTGRRTTMDAMRASSTPPVFSHSNPLALCSNRRNIDDEQIRAVADWADWSESMPIPPFVKQGGKDATVSDLVDHIDYSGGPDRARPGGVGVGFLRNQPRDPRRDDCLGRVEHRGLSRRLGHLPDRFGDPRTDSQHHQRVGQARLSLRRHGGHSRPQLDRPVQEGLVSLKGSRREGPGRESVR